MDHAKSIVEKYQEQRLKYKESATETLDGIDGSSSDGQESNDEAPLPTPPVDSPTIHVAQSGREEQMRAERITLNQELLNSSPTSRPASVSPTSQELRQRNFLVAQLVDSDDGNYAGNYQQRQVGTRPELSNTSNGRFPMMVASQEGAGDHHHHHPDSLLAKLMHEQSQRHDQTQAMESRLEEIGEALGSNGMVVGESHRHRGAGGGGGGSGAHKSNRDPADQQHKNRNTVDLDEHVKLVDLFGIQIVALTINGKERLCLAQISNTLLKDFSYNEIHNRRVALGITCVQCTPIQLEMLRRAGAMPSSSRRCGMITMREAERLCRSFLAEEQPPELPENFYFTVAHRVNYGCKGRFVPARYISSRAKCIECFYCGEFYSPNKFIFHSHKQPDATDCNPPDSPNINSWRKHINLDWSMEHSQEIKYAWEDVKSLFNGGTRRRTSLSGLGMTGFTSGEHQLVTPTPPAVAPSSNANSTDDGARKPMDETTKTTPSRSSLTSNNRKQQHHHQHHPIMEDDTNIDVVVCEARHGERGANMPPMSQNERRKLPIGAWPKERQQQLATSDHSQSMSTFKRTATHFNHPFDSMAQQQMKRLATQTNMQQQQQRPTTAANNKSGQLNVPLLNDQQSPLYQLNYAYHLDAANASNQHQASRLANLGLAQQANLNTTPTTPMKIPCANTNCLTPSELVARANQSPVNLNSAVNNMGPDQQLLSMPSSFIYGQLYSQLMQTQLAQQQQQQQQQQQVAPIEAQLALRQHIWSSLLANLRCNQGAISTPQPKQSNNDASHVHANCTDQCERYGNTIQRRQ